jgi:hypothetical protein
MPPPAPRGLARAGQASLFSVAWVCLCPDSPVFVTYQKLQDVFSLCDTGPFSAAIVKIPIWLRRLFISSPASFSGERRRNKQPEGMGLVGLLQHAATTRSGTDSFRADRHDRPPPFPSRETLPAGLTEDRTTASLSQENPRWGWGEIPRRENDGKNAGLLATSQR